MLKIRSYFIHILLFVITLLTTTLAGMEWMNGDLLLTNEKGFHFFEGFTWAKFQKGFYFSIPFLLFLTCHEFGHYFTALWHRVRVSLPYYIPLWLGFTFTIGTMGAFIQIKENLKTRTQYFDIGIAGPLAGFVMALIILFYGFTHLPSPEYVFEVNPEYKTLYPEEYKKYGLDYAKYAYNYPDTEENREKKRVGKPQEGMIGVGGNLLFWGFEKWVVPTEDRYKIPHPYEIFHYPFLFSGFLALLFTALNLMPIGQLDGGHILYGLIGAKWHARVAPVLFTIFVFYAGLGSVSPHESLDQLLTWIPMQILLYYIIFSRTAKQSSDVLLLALGVFSIQFLLSYWLPTVQGYGGWMAFAFLLGRFLGIYHPPAQQDEPLSLGRKILGWVSLLIFVLCASPEPLVLG